MKKKNVDELKPLINSYFALAYETGNPIFYVISKHIERTNEPLLLLANEKTDELSL